MALPGCTPFRVRQRLAGPRLEDVSAELGRELDGCGVSIEPGARIAIAVGSRGISQIARLAQGVVTWVKRQGGAPFVVPAMGSHGGATAEGQRRVLEGYGIGEPLLGAPILASMEAVEVAPGAWMDRHAFEADGTIVLNRVKPHTSFHGRYESGLMKMIAVGLGKEAAARSLHGRGVAALSDSIGRTAAELLRRANILLGVAVVENGRDEPMLVRAIPAAAIPAREPELLEIARAHRPSLPVPELDVLIVDEMGKNISGTGLDTQVIGRLKIRGQPEPARPRIAMIVVRDLSAESQGSAYGIGLADVTTRRLVDKIDWKATYANVLASGFFERGRLPLVADTDEEAMEIALQGCGGRREDARIVRIENTLRLETLWVSARVLDEIRGRDGIEVEP